MSIQASKFYRVDVHLRTHLKESGGGSQVPLRKHRDGAENQLPRGHLNEAEAPYESNDPPTTPPL